MNLPQGPGTAIPNIAGRDRFFSVRMTGGSLEPLIQEGERINFQTVGTDALDELRTDDLVYATLRSFGRRTVDVVGLLRRVGAQSVRIGRPDRNFPSIECAAADIVALAVAVPTIADLSPERRRLLEISRCYPRDYLERLCAVMHRRLVDHGLVPQCHGEPGRNRATTPRLRLVESEVAHGE